MSRVVHFEVHAQDPQRAMAFYNEVFDWHFSPFPGPVEYWLIITGRQDQSGINGGLIRRHGTIDGTAVIAYVCTVQVDSIDATITKVEECGGMSVLPKRPIPGVGWLAYCKDTEGNIFGIMHADPKAA
jgi:predicted enzyme related to lactoylglutathione lyase